MFHLLLEFLKKAIKKGGCYFLIKGREVRVGGNGLKREGLKLVRNYDYLIKICKLPPHTSRIN